jgi:hypothetical protein
MEMKKLALHHDMKEVSQTKTDFHFQNHRCQGKCGVDIKVQSRKESWIQTIQVRLDFGLVLVDCLPVKGHKTH